MSEEQNAIVPVEPDIRLGSIPINNPKELVARASELASALAEVINQQELFSILKTKQGPRKFVKCEGWTTMGAMLGVVPVEEYCRPLPDNAGFEAKIKLIRARDGGEVGAASAECTYNERNWSDRDSYSLRSMALTRATSKAFRLSFSWIIKLAGFEATPAEEMMQPEGSVEAQKAVVDRKMADHAAKQANAPVPALFYSFVPESNTYRIQGDSTLLIACKALLSKFWVPKPVAAFVCDGEALEGLKWEFQQKGIEFRPLKAA